jgi:hypothetical protein
MFHIQQQKKRRVNILLLGDSRVRQLRDGLLFQLTGFDQDWLANLSIQYDHAVYSKHEGKLMLLETAPVSLDYMWHTEMDNVADTLRDHLAKRASNSSNAKYPLDLIVLGNGAWTIRCCTGQKKNQNECVSKYKQ